MSPPMMPRILGAAKDQAKGAIGQPEVFLDNKAEEKRTKRLARGLGLKTYRMVDTPLRSSYPGAHKTE